MPHNILTARADDPKSIKLLLDEADICRAVSSQPTIMVKPNLVEALQPPITTPVEIVSDIVDYLKKYCPDKQIIIAEGSGALEYDTWHTFDALLYTKMAHEKGVELMDLNNQALMTLDKPQCKCWPQMHLPQILFDVFLISVPVLKAHSLAGVTLTLKNMMGAAPPEHYQCGGHWKKAAFHANVHEAVFDLNQYRAPDLTILDASVGMQEAHLWGPTCSPPHNIHAVSYDPVAIDAYGTDLLKRDWKNIGYIAKANGILGNAENYETTMLSK